VKHAYHLLRDRAGATHWTHRPEVLNQSAGPSQPVRTTVPFEALVFGCDEGSLQKQRNAMKWHLIVNVPPVPVRDRQRAAEAIQEERLSVVHTRRRKSLREGPLANERGGAEGERRYRRQCRAEQ
jgi:hypothetical protein